MMKNTLISAVILVSSLAASAASAACYADYKAKQDNPLKLHYGVIELRGDCNKKSAKKEIAKRISGDGWDVMNVMAVFDESGLEGRKADAGQYYLRY